MLASAPSGQCVGNEGPSRQYQGGEATSGSGGDITEYSSAKSESDPPGHFDCHWEELNANVLLMMKVICSLMAGTMLYCRRAWKSIQIPQMSQTGQ